MKINLCTLKRHVLFIALSFLPVGFLYAEEYTANITVSNPGVSGRADAPVVISLNDIRVPFDAKSAIVWQDTQEIPSQLDDLNKDGVYDELVFVADLKASSSQSFRLVFSSESTDKVYPSRVYAEMLLKGDNGKHQHITSLTTPGNSDVYNLLHHHGPAFESELTAYRIYFDRKQTVDIYGKFNKGLEIEASQFYPTDEQLAKGFGDDVLRVSGSAGLGTLKGWDGGKAIHIDPVETRTESILATGPVRTVVDVFVKDWPYQGVLLNMQIRYILYAGHRDCEVQVSFDKPLGKEMFAIGIQNIKGSVSYNDNKGLLACWGNDWPVNDTIKYAKETVGLALSLPENIVVEQKNDKQNYLYTIQAEGQASFTYYISFTSMKETFGYKDSDAWFEHVRHWKKELQNKPKISLQVQSNYVSKVWVADNGDGTYRNPILYADYSDPDAIRVGNDFYMTSSSFNCIPGLQILHSKDLVNWSIINAAIPYALEPLAVPEIPEHGNRIWAPCLRYHDGIYYIFWGDPDQGVFMTKTNDIYGTWSHPVLVKAGKGIIDTSPLWDDDGRVYLAHAYAGSRAGLKSVLAVCELNSDATKAITESRIVLDGHENHETVEGAKFYKRAGAYYIFAPAGGVATGWQLVLRADNPYGPYEEKVVLAQGKTNINGPHQGAWVDTQTGEDWFIHFQDVGAYGRIVHLQPMVWKNGWPVIGVDKDNDGCGEPVLKHKKPNVGKNYPVVTPQESDEFSDNTLGLQWQWHANFNPKWIFNDAAKGVARLYSYPIREDAQSLWDVPNLLLQKTPADRFVVTMKLRFQPSGKYKGERTGLLVMGRDYGGLIVENTENGITLSQVVCEKADEGGREKIMTATTAPSDWIYLRAIFDKQAVCRFAYSFDGEKYDVMPEPFQAKEGKWIGTKIGTFCTRPAIVTNDGGWADIDWFRITTNY